MKLFPARLTAPMLALFVQGLALALFASGCASEVGMIDRTQVNRIAKADLRGVWYEVDVITDLPPTASFGFAGQTNFGDQSGKVVFDVQQNFLVVYPYSERAVGGDAKWNKRKIRKYWDAEVRNRPDHTVKDSDFIEIIAGNPVAMYPIVSHFDVIRDYAPSTGEQTNILVENTTDKPWWQREYIRVDWSTNQINNFMFPQASMRYSGVDYFVPSAQDDKNGDNPSQFYMSDKKDYFHFTRRLFAQPMSTGACSPYSLAPGDCSGAAMEVRIAFRRVDPKRLNDYETRGYPNSPSQEKFGYFLSERYRFDEDYGLIYSGKDAKAARWNIWKRSKEFQNQLDDKGKPIACVTNRDCQAPAVCDQSVWFEPATCKIGARMEYSKRGIRPIVYHLSTDHPIDHLRGVYTAGDEWSKSFKETISWLLFWEKKWAADGVKGFTDPQSRFGQRLCSTNADCAGVAAAAVDVPTPVRANRVAALISKTDAVVVADCVQDSKGNCTDRDKLAGSGRIVLVNATPGAKVSLSGLPSGSLEAEYVNSLQDGKVNVLSAAKTSVTVSSGQFGVLDLVANVGGKEVSVPNVRIGPDEVVFVVVAGDKAAALRSKGNNKYGLRVVNAFASGDFEVGINGTRMAEKLEAGRGSDYLYQAGQVAQVSFVQKGHRADVTCATVQGVGQCIGWKQELNAADLAERTALQASLPPAFVVCENQFTRSYAKCKADGQLGKPEVQNDCRYWVEDGAPYGGKAGVPFNPCADVDDGGLVPEAAKMKVHGDARYAYVYWVTKVHAASPLGYGPSAADPDTGEIFWATANIYGASQITYAQYGKDLVDLINGDLDVNSLATGSYVKEYILRESKTAKDKSLFGAIADQLPPRTPAEELAAAKDRAQLRLADRAAAMLTAGKGQLAAADNIAHTFSEPSKVNDWLKDNVPTVDLEALQARAEKIKGSSVEAGMINDEMALVASEGAIQPGTAMNPEMIDKISPVGWATAKKTLDEQKRMRFLGLNSITLAEFQDPALVGLAQRLKCDEGETPTDVWEGDSFGKEKCFKGDALRTALSVTLFTATLEHEIGHTVGLRHNFSASADVLNYFDQYYDESKGGRQRDYVACGDVTLAGGQTLPADSFCESDVLGEKCKKLGCFKDADCPTGASCANSQCVDKDGVQVGFCQQMVWQRTACSADDACAGGLCVDGYCHDKVACNDSATCSDGDVCQEGACVDPRTQKPRTTIAYTKTAGDAKKYLSRAGLTESEIAGRRTEYQHSSVMDYGQKINADVHGLGKYDHAAIKYGYGELVEVYHDTTFLRDRTLQSAKTTSYSFEQMSWRMETEGWRDGLFPQFTYLNDWMPPEYNNQRDSVPAFFVEAERQFADNSFRGAADRTMFEVPYKYCSDEYRGGAMACYYFDTGATMEEIVHHAAEALQEYYIVDAFKRERLWYGRGGSPMSYMARIQDRWLLPIQAAGRYYAIYNNILSVYSWFPSWDLLESRLLPMRRASEASFRALTTMIATPAPGSYVEDKKNGVYVNTSYETGQPGSQLDVALGEGKFPWTTFATQKGYYMYDHPQWIGAYWDKIVAIMALTNSTAGFLSEYVGEQLPVFRSTAIGYNTIYPTQLAQVLGGLVAGDIKQFGATVGKGADGKTRIKPFDPFAPQDTTSPRVMPSVLNHSLRLFAAWQAIANLPAGFDPSYTDSMAVWLKGHGPQFEVGTGKIGGKDTKVELCEFEDPFGYKTYVAPKPNYSIDRYSAAYAMCRKLNTLKGGCADGSVCQPCAADSPGCSIGTCADKTPCRGDTWLTKATGAEKDQLQQSMKSEIEVLDYLRTLYDIYGNIGAGTN